MKERLDSDRKTGKRREEETDRKKASKLFKIVSALAAV